MSVEKMVLAGRVPVIGMEDPGTDMKGTAEQIGLQLTDWGFMAAEVPGIGDLVATLMERFAEACLSTGPSLADYAFSRTPQLARGGTQGFFPFNSEVPRLAEGVPDPKEFIHVSGAMLADRPQGAGAVLRTFPEFGAAASDVFDLAFTLISLFGEAIRSLMPVGTPEFGLSRDATNLRVIYYHDVRSREVLAHEHSGIQMLGLQLPPSDQGLQYVLHDGTWVEPVIAGTDVILCNVGRMLTSASNGRFRPSTHRVHCSDTGGGYTRTSSVMFAYPPHRQPQWTVSEDGITVREETWGDFIENRFAGLGDANAPR
jgi:hypothetical protein